MHQPEIVIIAAVAENNRVIGKDGKLPWYISEDLKRFKKLTSGHAVIMGRKTFESIIARLGKPLPERRHIVLTSNLDFPDFPRTETYPSLGAALTAAQAESEIFIIGGESLYSEALVKADRLELTMVEGNFSGDAYFPEYQPLLKTSFRLISAMPGDGYRFETYLRTAPSTR